MLCQLHAQSNTPSKQLRNSSYFYAVLDSASLKHRRATSTTENHETRDGEEEHRGGEQSKKEDQSLKRGRREARNRENEREEESEGEEGK